MSVRWFRDVPDLMSYVGQHSDLPPEIYEKVGFHGRADIFSYLRSNVYAYLAVEDHPHEPPLPDVYYACTIPNPGDGRYLGKLLDRFSFETSIDRDLFQGLLMTVLWGGKGGTRPAFLITADSGRGAGKSAAVKMVAQLVGGAVEIRTNEDAAAVLKRLLSPDGMTKRIMLLDNVKAQKFSSAELEGMITADVLSGHRLYSGEGRRPNLLTVCMTANAPSLSTDLAQRFIVIKLARPVYSGTWEEETRSFIDANRAEIIGDLIAELRKERFPLATYSRWSSWERDILERLPEPGEAQKVILERQGEVNVEDTEIEILVDHVAVRLSERGICPDTSRVFLPNKVVAEWVSEALGERHTTSKVTRMLKQFAAESCTFPLTPSPSHGNGRGFNWMGRNASSDSPVKYISPPWDVKSTSPMTRQEDGNESNGDAPRTLRGRFSA